MELNIDIDKNDNLIINIDPSKPKYPWKTNHKMHIKYLKEIYELYKNIKNNTGDNNDKYLITYECKDDFLYPPTEAIERLMKFSNGYYKKFISLVKKYKLDILIGGSSGIASVWKPQEFQPSDMDIYIKNITNDKIRQIDKIINESIDDQNIGIIIVRKSITITWVFFDKTTLDVIQNVQLNILTINSFAEVFICYHSDIVAIAYDVMQEKLICLENRWARFLHNKIRHGFQVNSNKCNFFTNFLSIDNGDTIQYASSKYYCRGFPTDTIITNNNNSNPIDEISPGEMDEVKNIIKYLYLFCSGNLYAITTGISEVLTETEYPQIIKLRYITTSYPDFFNIPIKLRDINNEIIHIENNKFIIEFLCQSIDSMHPDKKILDNNKFNDICLNLLCCGIHRYDINKFITNSEFKQREIEMLKYNFQKKKDIIKKLHKYLINDIVGIISEYI